MLVMSKAGVPFWPLVHIVVPFVVDMGSQDAESSSPLSPLACTEQQCIVLCLLVPLPNKLWHVLACRVSNYMTTARCEP